tara:strand:- start:3583 stop:4296 length:714 start_codon:yes stop_codon:yes gene_type:complete
MSISLSPFTQDLLKNFSNINKSIVIEPGNKISTISINKNILARATVEESFEYKMAFYDLSTFLGGISLIDEPQLSITDKKCSVKSKNGKSSTTFYYADPDIITSPPKKEIAMPDPTCSFELTTDTLMTIERAAKLYMVPDLCVTTRGQDLILTVTDKKNDTSNAFEIVVGEVSPDETFCYCMKVENLKVMSQAQRAGRSLNYQVSLSDKKVAYFKDQQGNLEYFIALEPDSELRHKV